MGDQTRLTKLISLIEQGLLLILWLVQVMALFFPWEIFVSPQGDALGTPTGNEGSGVSQAINIISYVCILLLSSMRWKGVFRTLWLAWPVLILCGWILLSVSWRPDPANSGAGRFLLVVVFSAYVAHRYSSLQCVGFLTRGFATTVLASVAVMVLVPRLGLSHQSGGYADAWRGAFTHKNWLGAAMSLGLVVSSYSYITRANHRFLSGLTFLGCLFLLIMSRSATAMLSTFASGLLAIVGGAVQSKRAPVFRMFAFIALGVAVVFLIILPLADINLNDLPRLAGRSSDLTGRTELWRAVRVAIRDRPLIGHGYGFWDHPSVARSNIWLAADWQAPHAHNTWLEAGLQLGLVGVVITAFIWLSALRRATWLVFVRYGHGALFYLIILFNCLSRSVVETVMFAPVLVSLFWLVISYIYIARVVRQRVAAGKSLSLKSTRLGGAQPAGHDPVPEALRY
jgi:exopolysaccharide production protein ExoQ